MLRIAIGKPAIARLAFATLVSACLLVSACSTEDTESIARDASSDIDIDRRAFRNIVIFMVDTLRTDHLSAYGYDRKTSPNFDRFAADAVLFERAYSVSPWTRTSVVSLFTSMYPVAHACQDAEDLASDQLIMMAELLQAEGFRTGAFSTNISVSEKFNLDQGFDTFVYYERMPWLQAHPDRPDLGYVPIEGMLPDTKEWLDEINDEPFFLYFHSTDPHWAYNPPAEFAKWGNQLFADQYDGEILYTDHYFQKLIDHLDALGKLDETLIIFTSDHGEELFDHGGQGHGHTLFNELLSVPLVMRHPDFTIGRRPETVRLVDVLPTVIDLFALDPQNAVLQGRSLVPLLFGQADPQPNEQFVLGEIIYPSKIQGFSLERDAWKMIRILDMQPSTGFPKGKTDAWELYRITADPGEHENVARLNPEVLAAYRKQTEELREKLQEPGLESEAAMPDEETLDTLRSLGYVE